MNSVNKKNSIILIAVIMAAVATSLFLVVKLTALFIVAYIVALIGIALLCIGNLYLLSSKKNYPWFASFPMTIWRYLISQLLLSAVFVLRENLFEGSFPLTVFIVLHFILHAFFAVLLILQKGGKDIIEARDAAVKEKVAALGMMRVDAESLIGKFPEYEKELRQVVDALRYSDPMSHPSLSAYEEQIRRGIMNMNDGNNIPQQCAQLLLQIADRNSRVKMLK